eukprot:1173226-Pyramimonas_sp.AAC.1
MHAGLPRGDVGSLSGSGIVQGECALMECPVGGAAWTCLAVEAVAGTDECKWKEAAAGTRPLD